MSRNRERGFSLMEVVVATGISSLLAAGVLQLLASTTRSYTNQQSRTDAVWVGRAAMDLMLREIRMAGYPAKSTYGTATGLTPTNSNLVAAPFITTSSTSVVFDADLDNNGVVERVEYRLSGTTLQRSAVSKNSNGSVPAASYQTVATNVANGSTALFTYTTDPNSSVAAPGNTNSVKIVLKLQTAPDPQNRQRQTYQFTGVAYRQNPDR